MEISWFGQSTLHVPQELFWAAVVSLVCAANTVLYGKLDNNVRGSEVLDTVAAGALLTLAEAGVVAVFATGAAIPIMFGAGVVCLLLAPAVAVAYYSTRR